MKKAVLQYQFNGLIKPPEDESGAIPYFLADYLMQHLEEAKLVSVNEFKDNYSHKCNAPQDEDASYIDLVVDLEAKYIANSERYHAEIKTEVLRMLKSFSFISDKQARCLHERFFVLEYYAA